MAKVDFKFETAEKIKKFTNIILIISVSLILFGIAFTVQMLKITQDSAEGIVHQLVEQVASNIHGRLSSKVKSMDVLTASIGSNPSYTLNDIERMLNLELRNPVFEHLSYSNLKSDTVFADKSGQRISRRNLSYDSCLQEALNGEACFAPQTYNKADKLGFINKFYLPVFNNRGQVIGALGSAMDSEDIQSILEKNDSETQAETNIVDEEGTFIIRSEKVITFGDTIYDNPSMKISKSDLERIRKDLQEDKSGSAWLSTTEGPYIMSYVPLGFEHLFVLTFVPKKVATLGVQNILTGIFLIVLMCGALLIALIKYVEKIHFDNEKIIYEVAFTDEITKERNKQKFLLDVKDILKSDDEGKYAVIMFELNKFNVLNELYGVKKSNKIIKDIATMIRGNLTKGSIFARYSESMFAVLLKYEKVEYLLKYFVDKVNEAIKKYNEEVMPKLTSNTEVRVVAQLKGSFGIYFVEDKKISVPIMCDRANFVKNGIIDNIKINYAYYDKEIREKLLNEKELEDEMYSALDSNQFQMYLQPKINMITKRVVGAEALARWIHPQKKVIEPVSFIPLFEKNGFIVELDKYICEQACRLIADRVKNNLNICPISINISKLHLSNEMFIDNLVKLVNKYRINPKYLELEFNETACFDSVDKFVEIADKLRNHGFTVVMDNVGTGYSKLRLLKDIPVDVMKFDTNFIQNVLTDSKGRIVVSGMVEMAQKLNIKTVAEGIETKEQDAFLEAVGCDIAQGFLYSKPLPQKEFLEKYC